MVNNMFPMDVRTVSGIEERVLYSGPIVQWLWVGTLPLFIALGQYLISKHEFRRAESVFNMLLSTIAAFVTWLVIIIIIAYVGVPISFGAVIAGGYALAICHMDNYEASRNPRYLKLKS